MKIFFFIQIIACVEWAGLNNILYGPFEPEKCTNIEIDDYNKYVNEVLSTLKEKKIKNKFGHHYPEILSEIIENPQNLVFKLQKSVKFLKEICSDQNKPDFNPIWSEDAKILKKQIFKFMYDHVNRQFDKEGYYELIGNVLADRNKFRFQQGLQQLSTVVPACDDNSNYTSSKSELADSGGVKFPGGSFRLNFGFNLSQWVSDQIMSQASNLQSSSNVSSNMVSMMAVMSVVSIIQTVLGIVVDVVPPMIPFPFWIFWSLPCLPMLTSSNCLFSVLYPVSLSEFTLGSTTDRLMDGIIETFPAKFASKVGKASEKDYIRCAVAYLGMHCASNFPMCWIPIGLREAMSFPMCFIHCILTLVACPGFWIDDIKGPCMNVSVPPLCSFSVYTNIRRIPPQYKNWNDSHDYSNICAEYDDLADSHVLDIGKNDENMMIQDLLNDTVEMPLTSDDDKLTGDLADYYNVVPQQQFECDCSIPCKITDVYAKDEFMCSCSEKCKQAYNNEKSNYSYQDHVTERGEFVTKTNFMRKKKSATVSSGYIG